MMWMEAGAAADRSDAVQAGPDHRATFLLAMLPTLLLLLILQGRQSAVSAGDSTTSAAAAQAHIGRGYEFEKDERFANAVEEFEAAIKVAPQLERVRYQLGVCYLALGRNQDARREFSRLRTETHSDPNVLYFLGRLDLADRNYDGAIGEFQAIVKQPPFPDTAYYLAAAYLERGDLAQAEEWLKRAEPLNPRDFRIPDHLARAYQRQGRHDDAEKAYARAAQLRQNYDRAAEQGIACSQALESGAKDARESCDRLFRPDDPDRLTLLGMIYGQHGHYAEALNPLQRAATLDPDSYEIEHNLGLTWFRLKRYDEARVPLERAVALRPDFFDSNALLGADLFLLKDDVKAYQVLHHSHELNPQDADSTELLFKTASVLGVKRFEAKDYSEATKYLREAENLRPDDPQAHARLADLYRRTGALRLADTETRTANELMRRQTGRDE